MTIRRPAAITRKPIEAPRSTRLLLAIGAVVVLVAVAVWAVFFSGLLAVSTVEVQGETTVSEQAILDAAAIRTGAPLARIDTGAVRDRVAAIAPIASVQITRKLPHTVVVTVTERVPALAVAEAGKVSIYDETGVLFRTQGSVPDGVPVLDGSTPTPAHVAAVLTVVRALPESVAARLSSIEASSLDAISLSLDGGAVHVMWGSAERSARKAQVLVPLMKHPALVYDVSAPDVPTTSGTPKPE